MADGVQATLRHNDHDHDHDIANEDHESKTCPVASVNQSSDTHSECSEK